MSEEITIKGITYQLTEPEFHFPPCYECAFGKHVICSLPEEMKTDAVCCKKENLRKVWIKKTQ